MERRGGRLPSPKKISTMSTDQLIALQNHLAKPKGGRGGGEMRDTLGRVTKELNRRTRQ